MAGMYGADVAQLKQLASQFERCATQLDGDRMTVGNAIRISAWIGPVAVRFRHEWDSSHSRKVASAAARLREAATALRRNAEEQERASSADSGAAAHTTLPKGADSTTVRSSALWMNALEHLMQAGIIDHAEWLSFTTDFATVAVQYKSKIANFDVLDVVPNGAYIGTALKGIGLGDSAGRFANAVRQGDWSGGILAGADAGATFAPTPIGLIWTGLTTMTGFFIPLDEASRTEHMDWMSRESGLDPHEIAQRYQGGQGFINLGNDNVERRAPWLNRAAEKVMQGPAELLYNMGVKL